MTGNLRLPTTLVGVGRTEEEDIHNGWDTFNKVKWELEDNLGFPAPREPTYDAPTLTVDDLTELHGKEYSEKYLQYVAWFNFSAHVVSYHEAKMLQYDNEMKQIGAKMREGMRERSTVTSKAGARKAPPLAEMEDKIRLDPRYLELGQHKQFHEQLLLIAKTNSEEFESYAKLMSRQIEIKKLEFETSNRENNMGQRHGGVRAPGYGRTPRTG